MSRQDLINIFQCKIVLMVIPHSKECRYGRVVKATDSKSVSFLERRFESYYLRFVAFNW